MADRARSTESTGSGRPPLSRDLTGEELMRWYWLRAELAGLARELGIAASGGKQELQQRIADALDGRTTEAGSAGSAPARPRPRPGAQLTAPLTGDTVVPAGQRCSQVVRAWFVGEVGPTFHFDAAMRAFFADADGTGTLADARAHWLATRDLPAGEIGAQFEFNRFTRAWHAAHPDGTTAQCRAAWTAHRALPTDQR